MENKYYQGKGSALLPGNLQ